MAAPLPTGTVTFLFTDIEGSTRLVTTLGDRYREVLSRHHELIREQISAHGGAEVETEGDAFFVAFSSAPSAIACAAAAQGGLASAVWPDGCEVRVRMGIHTGQGTLADGDYIGLDVHRAARISASAHGGQVVLSEATRALAAEHLPEGVALRDLGDHRLKDLPSPIRLYQLVIEGMPSEFPALRSLGRGNLPQPMTSFLGRDNDIAHVMRLLETARLVTLTGPGGAGKTRLLIEVAQRVEDRYPEGCWFVPLETVTEPDLVLPSIARTLSIGEEPGRPASAWLAEALSHRRLLLVLDNLEQVIAVAPQVAELLSAARELRAVCSSREPLRVSGEQEYPVPPLDHEPAVQLFVGRARQVRPDWEPSGDELEAVAEICRVLDGLPLAIELAAARIRLFPPRQLLTRLSERLTVLESGARDIPERQRTLRAAIDWSWDLLDPVEREVFERLAVFTGGADLTAIEAIIDPARDVTPDVLARLASLVEKSLVVAADGPTGEPRYRMLETIREYAAERFAGSAGERAVRRRHLEFFLEVTRRMESQLFIEDPTLAFARLEADHGNIRSAIEWSVESNQPALGFGISAVTWRFWQQRGHLAEGRLLLERLLAVPGSDSDPVSLARGLTAYGGITYWQGDHAAARSAYEKALGLQLIAGDEPSIAMAEYNFGWMLAFARDTEAAAQLLERSAARYRALSDERGELIVTEGLALTAMIAGDLERARDMAESVAADAERLGMRFHHADAFSLLAVIFLMLGDAANARRSLVESRAAFKDVGDVSSRASLLEIGAGLAVAERRPADAARLLGAIAGLRESGERFFLSSEVTPFADPEPMARDQLSKEEFLAAWEEGRAWPVDEALDYAV